MKDHRHMFPFERKNEIINYAYNNLHLQAKEGGRPELMKWILRNQDNWNCGMWLNIFDYSMPYFSE